MALMHAMTEKCSEHGHPELRLVYDCNIVRAEDVRSLLDQLEERVIAGSRLEVGASFQVGWMALQVARADDSRLALLEPDMVHTPVHWVDSVTHSLIHLRVQTGVCQSVEGLEQPVFPRQDQACTTGSAFESQSYASLTCSGCAFW